MIQPASRPTIRIPPFSAFLKSHCKAVVGWGRRSSWGRVCEMTARKGLPWLLLEDGFPRSVEREDAPLSLVVEISASPTTQVPPMHFQNFVSSAAFHLKVLSAFEPIIDMPRSGPE